MFVVKSSSEFLILETEMFELKLQLTMCDFVFFYNTDTDPRYAKLVLVSTDTGTIIIDFPDIYRFDRFLTDTPKSGSVLTDTKTITTIFYRFEMRTIAHA